MSQAKGSKRHYWKSTDFRRELSYREKKVAEIKREKMRGYADHKPIPRYMLTVDTSFARGNQDVLKLVLKELGWKEFPYGRKNESCDIHWHAINFEQNPDIIGGKVNKFPGMSWICSKINLFRVLDQMRDLYPTEFNFYPRTWYLPDQLHQFACDMRGMMEKKKARSTFIVKPDEGSQGEGIYLIRDPLEYICNTGRNHVAQEYLTDVLLIDKFKFDLRVYVVLTNLDPLQFYICGEGLARFSTVPYETPTNKNIHEVFMHLTNYSLNKKSSTFNKSEKEDEGSKRTLTSVIARLARMGFDTDRLWRTIERLVCKTMIAILPDLKIEYQTTLPPGKPGPSCFQILGFDILLLQNLQPMLLEINSGPSLRIDGEQEVSPGVVEYVPSPKDEEVKVALVRDALLLVAPQKKLRELERRRRKEREKREKVRKMLTMRKKIDDKERKPEKQDRYLGYLRRDGMIHVPTNHPRSSIVIIRADESNEDKKLNRLDTFSQLTIRSDTTAENPDEVKGENHIEKIAEEPKEEEMDIKDQDEDIKERDDENVDEDKDETDDDSSKSSNDDEGNEDDDNRKRKSCLKELYPDPYDEEFDRLRLFERVADIFITCLGVRSTHRLGPTGFRTFSRKCHLNKKGVTNASIDILYIDMQRKWEHVNPERTTGLCFRGFLDACQEIAKRKFFDGTSKLKMMEDFIEYCESSLKADQRFQRQSLPQLKIRRYRQTDFHYVPPVVPSIEETVSELYQEKPTFRQPKSTDDVNAFLKVRQNRTYVPRQLRYFTRYNNE
ncbi:hypothetical protein ACJMK2_034716 [Sinanodonta woodiana]|uniref:Uncharacterized protein n=1 Tax=Sinanodonta woodiana TaxID=1069815 RepID=A0ABD3WSI4_SINWO